MLKLFKTKKELNKEVEELTAKIFELMQKNKELTLNNAVLINELEKIKSKKTRTKKQAVEEPKKTRKPRIKKEVK